jgi:glycerol dehydrogenase-like iron-containing ADH family enzyme
MRILEAEGVTKRRKEEPMVRIMIAPNRYIQGPGVIKETAKYIVHSYFEVNPALVLGAIIGANALGEASLKASGRRG